MHSWKDALEQGIRRSVLKLLKKNQDISNATLQGEIALALKGHLNAYSDGENISEKKQNEYIKRCCARFYSGYRDPAKDNKPFSERSLFEIEPRTLSGDVFIAEKSLKKEESLDQKFFSDVINIFSEFSLKPFLGYFHIANKRQDDFIGDYYLSTPFHLLSLGDDSFKGYNDLLSKEKVKATGFLNNSIGLLIDEAHDYAKHKEETLKKDTNPLYKEANNLKKIEVRNRSRKFCFIVTSISNLIWHLIYPLSISGENIDHQTIRESFFHSINFLNSLDELSKSVKYQDCYFIKEIQSVLHQSLLVVENLKLVHEREQLAKISLNSMTHNHQVLSLELCESIFKLTYGDSRYAYGMANMIESLQDYLKKDKDIFQVFDDHSEYRSYAFCNTRASTILDVLILYANSDHAQKERWHEKLTSSDMSQASINFSSELLQFKEKYIQPIKKEMRVFSGSSFFNPKSQKVASQVCQRLLPLCVLARNQYDLNIKGNQKNNDNPIDEPGDFSSRESIKDKGKSNSGDFKTLEEQAVLILQQAISNLTNEKQVGFYHFDILHFVGQCSSDLATKIEELANVQFECSKLSQFLLFINDILSVHKNYLNYEDFRTVFLTLFNDSYQKSEEITKYVSSLCKLVAPMRWLSDKTKKLMDLVEDISNNYNEFNDFIKEIEKLPNCPYQNKAKAQHVNLIAKQLKHEYQALWGKRDDLPSPSQDEKVLLSLNSRTIQRRDSLKPIETTVVQVCELSKVIGGCLASMSHASKKGHKGGFLDQLDDMLWEPPFCQEKTKQVAKELARIVCSYRKDWLTGAHASYANTRSCEYLIEAIENAQRRYSIPLASWLFGDVTAASIRRSSNPRQLIQDELKALQDENNWALEDRNLASPYIDDSDYEELFSPRATKSESSSFERSSSTSSQLG